jgi:hypothetical protein
MYLINPGGNKEILCGSIYDLYPNKRVSKLRKFPISVDRPYEIETFAYIRLKINQRKLKDLKLIDYTKKHYLYFILNTLSEDIRYAFDIAPSVKGSIYEGDISSIINFVINKNYKIQVFVPRSYKIPPNPYDEKNSQPSEDIKIIVIKNKSFIPYL